MVTQKLLLQVCGLLLIIAPFAFWLGLRLAVRKGHQIPSIILPAMRTLRWIGWTIGVVLYIAGATGFRGFHAWPLGTAILAFSIGLSFPERWVKALDNA